MAELKKQEQESGKKRERGWSKKIRLAMGELEENMRRERAVRESQEADVWPAPEQVDAWNAKRQQERGSGHYCGSVSTQERGVTKEAHRREIFWKNVIQQVAKSAAFFLASLALVQGILRFLPESITVSSTVGGRELPIYCVETDKKQVALSFDAAWGNEDTRRILDILKKHNVKVTFFMTGGWVVA